MPFRGQKSSLGSARFEIDDPCGWLNAIQDFERVAPDVAVVNRVGNNAVRLPSERNVHAGVAHVPFDQDRSIRYWQDLIDPAARHEIAAKKSVIKGDIVVAVLAHGLETRDHCTLIYHETRNGRHQE